MPDREPRTADVRARTAPLRLRRGGTLATVAGIVALAIAARQPALAACADAPFVMLSVENGLSHGTVHTIVQDRRGLMWLGTEDGLSVFNGRSFRVLRHDPGNPESLASSNFGKILEDRDGNLWFGTWGGGLDRYDYPSGRFAHFTHDPADPATLSSNRVELLHEDADGILWIGTESAGLNRLDRATGRIDRFRHRPGDTSSLGNDRVLALIENTDGTFWIGTDAGVDRFDPRSGKVVARIGAQNGDGPRLSSAQVRALARDRNGALWIGTRGGGLNRLEPDGEKVAVYRNDPADPYSLSGDSIARLFVDSNGQLWVSTYANGLNCYRPHQDRFETVDHRLVDPDGLSGNRVESFWEDRSRVLWLGTRGGGVNRLDLKPRKFVNYQFHPDEPAGLPHPSVRAVTETAAFSERRIFVGTDGGGLSVLDPRTGRFVHHRHDPASSDSLSSDRVLSVVVEPGGVTWVGTYDGGLNRGTGDGGRFVFRNWQHDPAETGALSNDRIQVLLLDGDALWAGTADGLNRIERAGDGIASVTVYRHDPADPASLPSSYVVALRKDADGRLWVGTRNGLASIEPRTGRVERLETGSDDAAVSRSQINAIHIDAGDPTVLWVGTEDGGLNRVDTTTSETRAILQRDGLPSNAVQGVLQDDEGRLWLSTALGISRYDPVDEAIRNYDVSDGLLSHSFIRNAAYRDGTGRMFFGSAAGLAEFDPGQVLDNPFVPPVILTSFKRFNEPVDLPRPVDQIDSLSLSWKDNFFSFEFAALDYSNPANNRYRYRLVGVDEDWVDAGTRTFANYTDVKPGEYVFAVQGSNNDGIWNETGTSIRLSIEPPFWQTLWFRTLALAAVVLLVAAAYQWRTDQFRRRNQKLQSINVRLAEEVAERERAEAEREEFVKRLENKNAELERFTYTVSHDLKTPLVTIEGFLGLLEMDVSQGDSAKVMEDFAHIRQATGNMQRLLDDLLELSRAGVLVGPSTDVSLSEVAREAASLVLGSRGKQSIRVDIDPGMPTIRADRVRAVEIFQNLIENAVKFMGDQPAPRIRIGMADTANGPACFVADNGIGIDADHLDSIFGLFERLDSKSDGTGIGLALVKRLIEVYEGRIWVESDGPGKGSTFLFTLPGHLVSLA